MSDLRNIPRPIRERPDAWPTWWLPVLLLAVVLVTVGLCAATGDWVAVILLAGLTVPLGRAVLPAVKAGWR